MFSKSDQNMSTVNSKQRVLGVAENALIRTSMQYQGNLKVAEILHLQGPYISLEALISAVSHLQCRHPFLRSRLQNNPGQLNSYLMEEDSTLQLKIREVTRKRADHENYWRQEWREREKDSPIIGEGLAEFWLLQDPDDNQDDNAPREIIVICDHSICDGISLSTVAHELLLALSDDDKSLFACSLNWPITIESAVKQSISIWNKFIIFSKFICAMIYWRATTPKTIARIPLADIDFPLDDMVNYCHTEASFGIFNKEETQKLIDKCHHEGVTITSAIGSAILSVAGTLVNNNINQPTQMMIAIAADSRRRCLPPIPNHDLSYQVSGVMAYTMSPRDISTTVESMWQLARDFGQHVKTSIDAGHIFVTGMIIGRFYQKHLGSINLSQTPTCGLSNWGQLPFHEQYGQWQLLSMTPYGNLTRLAMPMVLVQTVNGVLTIGYFGAVPLISTNTLETLRDGTMNHLHRMIDN